MTYGRYLLLFSYGNVARFSGFHEIGVTALFRSNIYTGTRLNLFLLVERNFFGMHCDTGVLARESSGREPPVSRWSQDGFTTNLRQPGLDPASLGPAGAGF